MARAKRSTSARGYGSEHAKLREQWRPHVERGEVQCAAKVCVHEARLIHPYERWDLGHTADRTAYTGPEHERCNRADGARRGNRLRGLRQGLRPRPARSVWR